MTLLHAYFHFKNQQAFQRLLDGGSRGQSASQALSSSGGKSWKHPSPLTSAVRCDVNARDSLGRTVLHLAASARDASATEYVRLLLGHPNININLKDTESHWTALHRALFHGNLATAVLLLQRPEIDTSLKDFEGYTAFDLYNSTLEGTAPSSGLTRPPDLFTWGANRNAALGLGDGDDRTYPEQVVIRPADEVSEKENIDARFSPIHVRQIAMSKLHTAVVTEESRGNVRVCGFGSGGRLGPGQHTQYSLAPLPQFAYVIVSVALGQDHTLALTKSGEVLSWGLNRFSQLGYVVETLAGNQEPIQATARKITGPLKNQEVRGVAACKTASACWTDEEVYTWGTNSGQLGYDKAVVPVQIPPRLVSKLTHSALSVTITDTVLACLLETQDVVCFWNDGFFKINFPAYSFPSEIAAVYRPPHAHNSASIEKITSCDSMLAALSTNGELFTFSMSAPSAANSTDKSWVLPQPQRVWALRKQFSAVKDVALGSDGSIIICTESGHVFVRSRNLKSGQGTGAKTFKFQRVPFLQRVTEVCANSMGAYGALRLDHEPERINVVGNLIAQDLSEIQPFLRFALRGAELDGHMRRRSPSIVLPQVDSPRDTSREADCVESEDDGDAAVQKDIAQLRLMCTLLTCDKESRSTDAGGGLFEGRLAHGADIMVHLKSGFAFPAHRLMLAARCIVLEDVLARGRTVQDHQSGISIKMSLSRSPTMPEISFGGCQSLTVLILVSYLYSDEVLALWDTRIGSAIKQLRPLKIKPAQVKTELLSLARILELPLLMPAVDAPVKRVPLPSMSDDMRRLFEASQTYAASGEMTLNHPLKPNVVLEFGDKEVHSHSAILRARSPFFAAFFDDEDWTAKRWTAEGTIKVNLKHMNWRAVEPVVRFLCCGADKELFSVIESVRSVDELLEYVFDVLAAATELLLDRLVLLCSDVILQHLNISNVCYVLSDATHYHAMSLAHSVHDYMAANMETLLESRMLDDLTPDLIRQLLAFIHQRQAAKYPTSRSTKLIDKAMASWGDWLALQDVPQPIIPTQRTGPFKDLPKLSPPGPAKASRGQLYASSSPSSPTIRPRDSRTNLSTAPDDGVFLMDEPDSTAASRPSPVEAASKTGGWKTVSSAPRADMRAIMAEAQTSKVVPKPTAPASVARAPSIDLSLDSQRTPPQSKTARLKSELPERTPTGLQRSPADLPWRLRQSAAPPQIGSPSVPAVPSASLSTRLPSVPSSALGGHSPVASIPGSPRLQPTASPQKASGPPGLGPVFTPSKQSPAKSSSSSIRRVSSTGSVWTLPPVQPVVRSSQTGAAMSFAAIQQLQAEQVPPAKDKRSLREIQEEERARQVEADFLKWWAAEEERIKAEEQVAARPPPKAKKPKSTKKPPAPGAGTQKERREPDSKGKPENKAGSSRRGRPSKNAPAPAPAPAQSGQL